jgi:hypothetical protein
LLKTVSDRELTAQSAIWSSEAHLTDTPSSPSWVRDLSSDSMSIFGPEPTDTLIVSVAGRVSASEESEHAPKTRGSASKIIRKLIRIE